MFIYFVAARKTQDFCVISKSGIVFLAMVNSSLLQEYPMYRELLQMEFEIIHNTTSSYPVRKSL